MDFTEDEIGELTYLVKARIAELDVEEKSAKRMKNISIIDQERTLLEEILEKIAPENNQSGGRRRKNRKTRKNRKD